MQLEKAQLEALASSLAEGETVTYIGDMDYGLSARISGPELRWIVWFEGVWREEAVVRRLLALRSGKRASPLKP